MIYFYYFSEGNFEISLTIGGIKSCISEGTIPLFTLYMKESFCCCLLFDKVIHPHSLNKFSNATDLVNPVTKWAASFWIFCKVNESCSEHPSHTIEAHSRTVKRKNIYIWMRAFPLKEYFSFRMIPRILVEDRTIFSICKGHCPVLLKVTQ